MESNHIKKLEPLHIRRGLKNIPWINLSLRDYKKNTTHFNYEENSKTSPISPKDKNSLTK